MVGVQHRAGGRRRRCCPRCCSSTAAPARCPARCGSSRTPGSGRWPAPAARPRAAPPPGPCPAGRRPRPGCGSRPRPSGSPSPSSLRIAASCWRSRNSRWLFSMPSRTSSRIFSATSISARCARVQSIEQLEPLVDVGGLEELALLLVGQVRRPAGGVGQRGRVGHLLHGVDHLPGVPLLQDGDHQRLVLGGQLAGLPIGHRLVVDEFGLTQSAAPGPETPVPIRARWTARSTAAGRRRPSGRPARWLRPRRRWRSGRRGGAPAAVRRRLAVCFGPGRRPGGSMAACAASSSSIGTTMPGSTTTSVRRAPAGSELKLKCPTLPS